MGPVSGATTMPWVGSATGRRSAGAYSSYRYESETLADASGLTRTGSEIEPFALERSCVYPRPAPSTIRSLARSAVRVSDSDSDGQSPL